MVSFGGAKRTGKHIASDVSNKNVTFMAAGIAYNAFVSLAPTLLLLLFVVSVFGGGLEERLVSLTTQTLPGPIADVIVDIFQGGSTVAGASAIGLVVLLWGTMKIFRGLDTAFSEIYETEAQNSIVDQLTDGLVVLVALVVAVVATAGASVLFAWLADAIPYVGTLTPILLVVGLILAFLPMYVRFPDADLGWRDALPGTVFAAVSWAVLQALFQVYLSFKGGGSEGFFGGVIIVVTWLYFSGLVLLVGAVINSVLSGESSGKAGGVGQGASGYETRRETGLSTDEFARYLRSLREDVTGHYESARPTTGESDRDEVERPRPRGEVTVIEQSRRHGDEEEWSVAFRWRGPADESDRTETTAAADD